MGWNLATERTNFARYIPHYQIQRAVYVLLCRLLPATIPFLVGPSEETEVSGGRIYSTLDNSLYIQIVALRSTYRLYLTVPTWLGSPVGKLTG
jgi:hypothetical protein